MTARLVLPDGATSRAVLIGAHTYDFLDPLPSVAANLTGLRDVLTDSALWGLPAEHCVVMAQPASPRTVLDQVHDSARQAADTLIVYFAGHGTPDLDTGELCLALPDSNPDRAYTMLRFDDVRRLILGPGVRSRRKVVILDCCYSGRALPGHMTAGQVSRHVANQAEVDGTCVLTASPETRTALAPPDERYTAFTGELISTLTAGVPNGMELLDMETVYVQVYQALQAKNRPLPQQRNRNLGGMIALVRNAAFVEPEPRPDPQPEPVVATEPAPARTAPAPASAPKPKLVELRVHGINGTPPERVLDNPKVRQVAGDTTSRFFRPVDASGHPVRAAGGHLLESYDAGTLASGSWRKSLGMVLMPFGLLNAAYFMLPDGGDVARAVARAALRVLAITLTCLVVLGLAHVAVDLFAWQWTGGGEVAGDPRWWLTGAVAVVTVGVLVLRFIGGPTRELRADGDVPHPAPDAESRLADDRFYRSDDDLPALRHLHLTASLAVLSVLAGGLARQYGGADWPYWIAVGLLGWTVVHTALIGDSRTRWGIQRFFAVRLPVLVLGVGVMSLVASTDTMALVTDYPVSGRGILPGVIDVGRAGVVLALLSLVVLFMAAAVLAVRTRDYGVPPPYRRFIGGMLGPVVATLGVFFCLGFTSALGYGTWWLLQPGDDPSLLALPVFSRRVLYAAGCTLMVAVVLAVLVMAWSFWSARRFSVYVRAASTEDVVPDYEVPVVARAWRQARLKYLVHRLAVVLAVVGGVLTVAAVVETAGDLDTLVCHPSGTWLSDCRDRPGLDLVTLGTVTMLALGGFLAYQGTRPVADRGTRLLVSVFWDVVSFWPAATHPFVPPSHAPKVVEDLRRRIEWHVSSPNSFLLLAGHCQGSLIAAAALSRLSPEYRSRVALLTSGSQLQFAYARAFPAYVNHRFLHWLESTVLDHRWISLYRETDPAGGPVLSWDRTYMPEFTSCRLGVDGIHVDEYDPVLNMRRCGNEWCAADPKPSDGVYTPKQAMRRHADFSSDPLWALAFTELTISARDDPPPGPTPV